LPLPVVVGGPSLASSSEHEAKMSTSRAAEVMTFATREPRMFMGACYPARLFRSREWM
jgi:hypothetical protein